MTNHPNRSKKLPDPATLALSGLEVRVVRGALERHVRQTLNAEHVEVAKAILARLDG